jgi:hypothetical protein
LRQWKATARTTKSKLQTLAVSRDPYLDNGRHAMKWLFLLLLFGSTSSVADDLELAQRYEYWKEKAFHCPAGDGTFFPSRPTGEQRQPCDDGDMTLFNGLLCAGGNKFACAAVAAAQDATTGQWFRSPRIRLSGNDRGGSAFSPDMALGVQLYLVNTGDTARALKWLHWLHRSVPCSLTLFGRCMLHGVPRFCTDDVVEKGCIMRPGDAAALAATVTFLQTKFGMEELPDGRLRGYLGSMSGLGPQLEEVAATVNRPGFSQHLVGVSVLHYRSMGLGNVKLDKAAQLISGKNPGNAFYSILARNPRADVVKEILNRCPNPHIPLKYPLRQWQWERENADMAWESSSYWDCIFIWEFLSTNTL